MSLRKVSRSLTSERFIACRWLKRRATNLARGCSLRLAPPQSAFDSILLRTWRSGELVLRNGEDMPRSMVIPPSLAPRPHPLAADLFEETEEEKEPARDLPEAMMTQNPLTLTVSTLEERELGDDDVGIQRQKLLPVSIEEEVSTKKPKLFGGIRSLLGKKSPAHAPLPSEAARGDLESPPRSGASYDRIQTSSPFHKPPERSLDGDRMSPRATSSSKPVPATSVLEQKPEALEGWLEKKNKGGLGNVMKIGHSWNRR
jgi:hypothetical protein